MDNFMRLNRNKGIYVLVLLFAAVLWMQSVAGCSNGTAYDPSVEYSLAVQDASNMTYDKISRDLTAVVKENKDLIWENGVAGSRVLVVAWVNESIGKSYKCPEEGCQPTDTCKEGKECPGYKWDTWVTVVPELKNFFRGTAHDPLRIAQLLGLPPSDASKKVYMVEFWVSPDDLYRPCPDPEITDHECQVDFPADQFRMFDNTKTIYADQACDLGQCGFKDYRGWFDNRRSYIYTSSNPYPWTGLGYTYDWGNPQNHRGLSEFVIHGSKENGTRISVGMHSVKDTATYLQ